ncbi:MAG: hypothetical protein ACWGOX_09725 [Desulforhopalus sp.]
MTPLSKIGIPYPVPANLPGARSKQDFSLPVAMAVEKVEIRRIKRVMT